MTTNYHCMVYHTTTASTPPPNVKLSSAIPKIKWSNMLAICSIIQSTPHTPETTVSMNYPVDRLKTALGLLYGTILTDIAENPANHKSTKGAFS
jgi:hypothetical protein